MKNNEIKENFFNSSGGMFSSGWNGTIDVIKTVGTMSDNLMLLLDHLINLKLLFFDIFYYITDPLKMLSDIRHGFFTGITLIYETLVDFIFGNLQSKLNYRNINTLNNKKDNFVKNTNCNDPNSHCYSPSFITIVLLILCPPFAMLLLLGMSGILHIIICCILTYFFYFPGLIYASLFVL